MQVVYEDNHIIVINKKSGIPSQADKTGDMDALSLVKEYLKEKYNKPGEAYCGLVHRLDRETSGLMLFAKTSKAASRISEYIRNGDFKKEYIAVVYGILETGKSNVLEDYIIKDEKNNKSIIVDSSNKNAKYAKLEYTTLKNFKDKNGNDLSYIKVKLYTGRHHQIRVQMSHIGHPLYGDIKYGGKKGSLALFASHIELIHPTRDEILSLDLLPEKTGIWEKL